MSRKPNIDLSRQRFGKLVVIEEIEKGKSGETRWDCLCDCGKHRAASSYQLTSGKASHCGCGRFKYHIGQTFGHWTLIDYTKNSDNNKNYKLRCNICETVITTSELRNRETIWCRNCNYGRKYKTSLFEQWKSRVLHEVTINEYEFLELSRGRCFYCGAKPSCKVRRRRDVIRYRNTIDRIDSSKGYTPENTVSSCWRCNRLKGSDSQVEFAKNIIELTPWAQKFLSCGRAL